MHVRVLLLGRCKKLLVLSITLMFGIGCWINNALLLDEGPPVNQKVSYRNHLFFQDIFIGYSVPPTGFSRTDWIQLVLLAEISE